MIVTRHDGVHDTVDRPASAPVAGIVHGLVLVAPMWIAIASLAVVLLRG